MALTKITTAELQQELARREKSVSKLESRRDKLRQELTQVENEIAALRGGKRGPGRPAGAPTVRRRAKNAVSLPDAIAAAMEVGAIVSPKEASELVRSNGYKTTSANFNMMVSNALAKDKRFKRLGRGQYERMK